MIKKINLDLDIPKKNHSYIDEIKEAKNLTNPYREIKDSPYKKIKIVPPDENRILKDNQEFRIDPFFNKFYNKYYFTDASMYNHRAYDTRWKDDKLHVFYFDKERKIEQISEMECPVKDCTGTITKIPGVWYGRCNKSFCNSIGIFFIPTKFQETVIGNDLDTIILTIGGYGSGKSTTNAAKVFRHLITIPNAYVIVVAQTLGQLTSVGQKELLEFIPKELFLVKNEKRWVLKNGGVVVWVASDKEDKIRGQNATMAWGIEVNLIKLDVIDQLRVRIRNTNAVVFAYDENGKKMTEKDRFGYVRIKTIRNYTQLLLESNPDPNSEVLRQYWKKARVFFATPSVKDPSEYIPQLEERGDGQFRIAVTVTTSIDNPYVDKKNIEDNMALKGVAREKFVLCNLSLQEGLRYDKWPAAILPRNLVHIGLDWPRLFVVDFGSTGPTVMVCFAVDPDTGKAYIYDSYQKRDSAISNHVGWMWEKIYGSSNTTIPPWPILDILGDPAGNFLREGAPSSLFDQYAEYGIVFSKAENSKGKKRKSIDGYAITNDMFEMDMLKVLDIPENELLITQLQTISLKLKQTAKGNKSEADYSDTLEEVTPYRDDFADCVRYGAVWLSQNQAVIDNKRKVSIGHMQGNNSKSYYINGRLLVDGTGGRSNMRRGSQGPRVKVTQSIRRGRH